MASEGIQGIIFETHNWGKSAAFWQALGYTLDFETDHHSGQLSHPAGGPFLFIVERPETQALEMQALVRIVDADSFEVPDSGEVDRPFEPQHWGVQEMLVRDPDGRRLSVQAPLPEGVAVPQERAH